MKKGRGLIIAAMVFFLTGGITACIAKQYMQEKGQTLSPVFVRGETVAQPEKTPEPTAPPVSPEPAQEPEPTPQPQETAEKPKFYTFAVQKDITSLHVRATPGMDGEIIGRLMPGETGYVLERGEDWSLVTTEKKTGYVSNRYIGMQEIPEEEFPAEYKLE